MSTPTGDCPNPSSSCSFTYMPFYSQSPPTDFSCPAGAKVVGMTLGVSPDGNNNCSLGCMEKVVCDDGTTLSQTAGNCTVTNANGICAQFCPGGTDAGCNGTYLASPSCVNAGGVIGFAEKGDAFIGSLQPLCADGSNAVPLPPFNTNPGQDRGRAQCPTASHYMNEINVRTSCNADCVTSLVFTCQPLSTRCTGDRLNTPECISYCNNNVGACDSSLRSYCSNSANYNKTICGCALPDSQYPIRSLQTSNGVSVPTACDKRCQSTSVIQLSNTGTCNIGVVCIQAGIDITAVQSSIGKGVTLSQQCGSGATGTGTTTSFFRSTTFYIIAGVLILLLLTGLVVAIILATRKKKKPPPRRTVPPRPPIRR